MYDTIRRMRIIYCLTSTTVCSTIAIFVYVYCCFVGCDGVASTLTRLSIGIKYNITTASFQGCIGTQYKSNNIFFFCKSQTCKK